MWWNSIRSRLPHGLHEGSYQIRIRLIPDTFQVIIGQESDSACMLKSSSRKGVRTLTAQAQLMRAVQIELRCVQEYTVLDETCLPEWMMELIQTHIRTAQQLSRRLWEDYGLTVHHHGPWEEEEEALFFKRA